MDMGCAGAWPANNNVASAEPKNALFISLPLSCATHEASCLIARTYSSSSTVTPKSCSTPAWQASGNIDGAAHSIDHAHELRRHSIANRFDDPASMFGNFWVALNTALR
jgi:hypothetical protein